MNVIENCWGYLSQAVYKGRPQFETVYHLCGALVYEWETSFLDSGHLLIDSIKRIVRHLWKCDGREANY